MRMAGERSRSCRGAAGLAFAIRCLFPAGLCAAGLLTLAAATSHGEIAMTQMPNGVRLIVKPTRANRILAISCYFNTGSYFERPEESGITSFVCRTMLKGTRTRTALEIAAALEEVGGEIFAAAGEDFSEVSTISIVEDIDVALDALRDVILHPTFPPDEVEKEREAILAAIRRQEDSAFQYTYRHFRELLYAGHPYARPVLGTAETVAGLTQAQLVRSHANTFTASNLLVIVVGDVEPESVARKIAAAFAELPAGRMGYVLASKRFRPRARRKTLEKEVEQAFIIAGFPTDRATSPDYPALKVACAILGTSGSMSTRLFRELRDKRGLAYAVGSSLPTLREKSHYFAYIGTKPESIEAARAGLLEVIRGLIEGPLPAEELERAKTFLIGQFRIAHQRNSAQADFLALYEMVGLGARFDEQYPARIRQVTAEQVKAAAAKYFRSPTITILQPPRQRQPLIQRIDKAGAR